MTDDKPDFVEYLYKMFGEFQPQAGLSDDILTALADILESAQVDKLSAQDYARLNDNLF